MDQSGAILWILAQPQDMRFWSWYLLPAGGGHCTHCESGNWNTPCEILVWDLHALMCCSWYLIAGNGVYINIYQQEFGQLKHTPTIGISKMDFKKLVYVIHHNSAIHGPSCQSQAVHRGMPNTFGAHFGIKCSSFCKVNVGTSQRSACTSLGQVLHPSVRLSNKLLERTLFWGNHGSVALDLQISFGNRMLFKVTPIGPMIERALWLFFTVMIPELSKLRSSPCIKYTPCII